jgi:hypothetical protein
MTSPQGSSGIDELEDVDAQDAKERRVLARLLDRYSHLKGRFLATQGEMGTHAGRTGLSHKTPSYVVSHDMMWIANNLLMGSEMPFMKSHIDEATGRLLLDESSAEELKQRKPDWSRQAALTAYLAHDKARKFGSILAVINPEWVDEPSHENWGKDGRAIRSAAQFDSLDSEGRIGLLDLENALVYALDGQHRVMALRGVKDLMENKFYLKNADGKQGPRYPQETFVEEFNLEPNTLQSLLKERMHVEYIPAVLAGETREEGSRRVRSIFVAINSYAKKPTKGENLTLDEMNGYALVARRIALTHPLLKSTKEGKEGRRSRVNFKSSALPDRSEWYTTLDALTNMAEDYLTAVRPDLAKEWQPKFKGQVPVRPDEDEQAEGSTLFADLMSRIQDLPVFQELESAADTTVELGDARAFPSDAKENGRGHLLLRPIGQEILAAAVGRLTTNTPDGVKPMTLDQVFQILAVLDRNGRFEAHRPQNLWYGVTYNLKSGKMDTSKANRELAVKLLIYLVRGADEKERRDLLRSVIKSRLAEGKWRPFDGGEPIEVRYDKTGEVAVDGYSLPVAGK